MGDVSKMMDLSMVEPGKEDEYRQMLGKGKDLASRGSPDSIKRALKYYKRALALNPSCAKLQRRMNKMQEFLDEHKESDEENGEHMSHVGDGFYMAKNLYDHLFAHQRQGVLFLYSLYVKRKGGILGDDMGAPGIDVYEYHEQSKSERASTLRKVQRKGGVLLTSYGIVQRHFELLSTRDHIEFTWDYVILDEGHKVKNPSAKSAKAAHGIPARNRILLSGTPLMNNLMELWAVFDWTHEGQLLGSYITFKQDFEKPIAQSRQKDASAAQQRIGGELMQRLRKIINPYFLRRVKNDVGLSEEHDATAPRMPTLKQKNEFICWVYLSDAQKKAYEEFSTSNEVKMLLTSSRSPLTACVMLKKICDHLRLFTNKQCKGLGLTLSETVNIDALDDALEKDSTAFSVDHIPDEVLIAESGKMRFLVELLGNLRDEGHRTLVFSMSRRVLDIVQKIMGNRGHHILRLDGTCKKEFRQNIIDKFNTNDKYKLFLLTSQVGGVGLTLTGADRVVIYDPSWNPATDSQAVDRAYRIGQAKSIVVYRLITCATIEEKIYRRQVFKDSINKMLTGDCKNPVRYFSEQQLKELFTLGDTSYSETQCELEELHKGKRRTDSKLDEHIKFLHTLCMFGISDHDLVFSQDAVDENLSEQENVIVQDRITQAQARLQRDCDENLQKRQQTGKYSGYEPNSSRFARPRPFVTPGDFIPELESTRVSQGDDKPPRKPLSGNVVNLPNYSRFSPPAYDSPFPVNHRGPAAVSVGSAKVLESSLNDLTLQDAEDETSFKCSPLPKATTSTISSAKYIISPEDDDDDNDQTMTRRFGTKHIVIDDDDEEDDWSPSKKLDTNMASGSETISVPDQKKSLGSVAVVKVSSDENASDGDVLPTADSTKADNNQKADLSQKAATDVMKGIDSDSKLPTPKAHFSKKSASKDMIEIDSDSDLPTPKADQSKTPTSKDMSKCDSDLDLPTPEADNNKKTPTKVMNGIVSDMHLSKGATKDVQRNRTHDVKENYCTNDNGEYNVNGVQCDSVTISADTRESCYSSATMKDNTNNRCLEDVDVLADGNEIVTTAFYSDSEMDRDKCDNKTDTKEDKVDQEIEVDDSNEDEDEGNESEDTDDEDADDSTVDELTQEDIALYAKLVQNAQSHIKAREYEEAVLSLEAALEIYDADDRITALLNKARRAVLTRFNSTVVRQ